MARPNKRLKFMFERTELKEKIKAGNIFFRIETAVAALTSPNS